MADSSQIDPTDGGTTDLPARPPRTRAKVAETKAADAEGAGPKAPNANATETSHAVAADMVSITQGGIRHATARAIDVRQGGIANATAQDIAVSMGGVGLAKADRVSVEMGAVGLALAGKARVTQGYARTILAREARLEQTVVGALITGRVTVERTTGVLLLVAGRVDGPVKAVFDWRGALAFGAAFGLLWGIMRRR